MVALLAEGAVADGADPLVAMTLRGWVVLVEGACLAWLQERPVSRAVLVDWLVAELSAMLAVTSRG
jgi:hypothetical protein